MFSVLALSEAFLQNHFGGKASGSSGSASGSIGGGLGGLTDLLGCV